MLLLIFGKVVVTSLCAVSVTLPYLAVSDEYNHKSPSVKFFSIGKSCDRISQIGQFCVRNDTEADVSDEDVKDVRSELALSQ